MCWIAKVDWRVTLMRMHMGHDALLASPAT
jgi:hypothetical protein